MRNLDTLNPVFLKPSRTACLGAFILLAMALLGIPLAYGAAPNIPLLENPIVLFLCAGIGVSSIIAAGSAIFKWEWKAKYYGVSFLCFSSVSFLALVPCLAVLLYGRAPYVAKIAIALIYGLSHFHWCQKFSRLYRSIFDDVNLRATIYEEELDAIYYMRRGDEFLVDKYYKFSQTPRDRYFALFITAGLLMMPAMEAISSFVGAPFVQIFLLVAMLPVSWMSIGFAVRGFLIFYLYPRRIKRMTGKDVYVDLVSKHRPIVKRQRSRSA